MAKGVIGGLKARDTIKKRTSQGHGKVKMASMNKSKKASYKKYRGQGK